MEDISQMWRFFYKAGATKSAEIWLRQLLKVKRWEPRKRDPERLLQKCLFSKELHICFCSRQQKYSLKRQPQSLCRAAKCWDGEVEEHKHAKRGMKQSDCLWQQRPRDLNHTASCCRDLAWGRRHHRDLKITTWEKAGANAVGNKEQPH